MILRYFCGFLIISGMLANNRFLSRLGELYNFIIKTLEFASAFSLLTILSFFSLEITFNLFLSPCSLFIRHSQLYRGEAEFFFHLYRVLERISGTRFLDRIFM